MMLTLATKSNPLLQYSEMTDDQKKGSSKFRYLIIVDLEATCDFGPKPLIDNINAEIIEFPWVSAC